MILQKGNIITNEAEVIGLVKNFLGINQNLLLTYLNQHCFNLYNKIPEYRRVIDEKFNVYMDGAGVFYSLKLFKHKNIQKFNASDLNEKLLEYFTSTKEKLFIVGGNFTNDKIQIFKNKGLNFCGYQSGFFNLGAESGTIDEIKKAEPDVIIIGMGIPNQEIFASRLSEHLSNKKIICVGNFLEFYLGTVKRIPRFFRNFGIEWIFRLITEPKRLWRRYVFGIPQFIISIIMLKFKSQKKLL